MPTTCWVVGCANRQSKDSDIKFYRFPADRRRHALWVSAVKRVNDDGKLWEPNVGHRVCSIHFMNGEKVDDPLHPSYVTFRAARDLQLGNYLSSWLIPTTLVLI